MTPNNPSNTDLQRAAEQQALNETATGQRLNRNQRNQKPTDKLNPDNDKFKIKKALRGLHQEKTRYKHPDTGNIIETQEWVVDKENALVNEKGFRKIWSLIEGLMNTNVTYAYQNPNDETYSGLGAMNALIKNIVRNYKQWGIDDAEEASLIVAIVHANIKASLSKARGGRGMRNDETIREEREVRKTGDENNENQGVIKSLFN